MATTTPTPAPIIIEPPQYPGRFTDDISSGGDPVLGSFIRGSAIYQTRQRYVRDVGLRAREGRDWEYFAAGETEFVNSPLIREPIPTRYIPSPAARTIASVASSYVSGVKRVGRFATQAEIQAQLLRGASSAQQEALRASFRRQAAHAAAERMPLRRASLGYRGYQSGGSVVDAGNQLITMYVDQYYEAKRRGEQRTSRLAHSGPLRALATREFQPSAVPGRRGGDRGTGSLTDVRSNRGAATRAALSRAERAGQNASQGLSGRGNFGVASSKTISKKNSLTTSEMLARQREQHSGTSAKTGMPSKVQASLKLAGKNILQSLLDSLTPRGRAPRAELQGELSYLSPGAELAPAVTSPVSSPISTSSPATATLTAVNPGGVASRPSKSKTKECDCPEPKKPEKKQFACSNPIISRSVSKDGVITIKRKLLCPPSSKKLA